VRLPTGLSVPSDYKYDVGDCLFNAFQHLTGLPSVAIRVAAVAEFRRALASGRRWAVVNLGSMLRLTDETTGGVLPPDEYVRRMCLNTKHGGLWADTGTAHWAAVALGCHVQEYNRGNDGRLRIGSTLGLPRGVGVIEFSMLFSGPGAA
jgi:hypothetical protein